MTIEHKYLHPLEIKEDFLYLINGYLKAGLSIKQLKECTTHSKPVKAFNVICILTAVITVIICILYEFGVFEIIVKHALGVRCIIPNNYFVWEATRPISDCQFCINVTEPIILPNVSQNEFIKYMYSSKPIVIKKAVLHWPALSAFSFKFFKNLYDGIKDAYTSVDEECQFLHFRSNFISLRDVFAMTESRINNEPGQVSWYVGWGNCDPDVLAEMRRYYPKPHFIPDDAEMPAKEYVFMGYDAGATMHLDFINRLMWQAQLKGRKTWYLKPTPECEGICQSLSFSVEPGDASNEIVCVFIITRFYSQFFIVLVDTRVWYHGTMITPGEFSLAIQSEYG